MNTISKFVFVIVSTFVLLTITIIPVMAEYQSLTISPRSEDSMKFYLNDGDKLEYTVSVSGGKNNDIVLDIKNPFGGTEISKGRVYGSFSGTVNANTDGYYLFEFDNSISIVSKKTVLLNYEIIKKPILSNIYDSDTNSPNPSISYGVIIIGILLLGIIVPIVLVISKSRKSYKEGKEESLRDAVKVEKSKNIKSDDLKNLGILKERLAKGEITKKEYDELKKEFE
jgi:uncharacterized membrane protein